MCNTLKSKTIIITLTRYEALQTCVEYKWFPFTFGEYLELDGKNNTQKIQETIDY